MAFGAVFFVSASLGSSIAGILVDFAHRPAFATITQSVMDLTILGKIPGTNTYIDFTNMSIALITLVCVIVTLKLYVKARAVINTDMRHPRPEVISI